MDWQLSKTEEVEQRRHTLCTCSFFTKLGHQHHVIYVHKKPCQKPRIHHKYSLQKLQIHRRSLLSELQREVCEGLALIGDDASIGARLVCQSTPRDPVAAVWAVSECFRSRTSRIQSPNLPRQQHMSAAEIYGNVICHVTRRQV